MILPICKNFVKKDNSAFTYDGDGEFSVSSIELSGIIFNTVGYSHTRPSKC